MFDFFDIDPTLVQLLATILRLFKPTPRRDGDPDETEVEPNP